MRRSWITAAAALGLAAAPQSPPAQKPTFTNVVRTVAVYTTVTAADGRLVPDLTREDFEVADNGKRQELSVFANDVQPITVVLMLDRSGSMRGNFELVQRAAEQFVDVMLPGDSARIGSFSNRIQVDPRAFTSDHGELISILRHDLQEAGPTPLWNAVNVGITALLHQQGRRVVLVFTDGMDRPMNGSSNNSSLRDVMKRAEEEDTMVYAIGLTSRMDARGGGRGFGRGGYGGRGMSRGGYRGFAPDKPDDGLPQIADATGGGYFELTSANDLAATFKRVAGELHHQYVLGFTPIALDGKVHKLTVTVRKPGMTARARQTYVATPER